MKRNILSTVGIVLVVALASTMFTSQASAQQPIAYTTVQPAVVGYQYERRGVFGLQSRWNPVVAPVATTTVVQPRVVVPPPQPLYVPVAPRPVLKPVTYVAPVTPAPVTLRPVTLRPVTVTPVYNVRY